MDLNEASIDYGQTATGLIELLVIIAGTCIALSILWAVVSDRLMLSRLSKLSKQVSDIGSKKDISNRIEINEKGGFSDLAKSFNRTLDALQSCEKQLKESEKRYRTIVEDQTEFIARFTADGTLTFVNSNLVKLIGLSPEQILGHSVHEVLPEYLHKQVKHDDEEISPGNPMVARENKIVLQNGSVRWFVWNIHGTFDEQGTLIELQAVGRDVTETREAEEALALANNKLNLMSSITRHDMMNKLTVAEGCISLIKMNKDPSRNNIYLSKAEEALIVMQQQLEFTRDYQSMGMNKPVWIDIRNVVKKAADNFFKGEVNISIHVDDYEIYADPLIEKVFYNLMDNSVRHGLHVRNITITSEIADNELKMAYVDDGIGIPQKEKELIFVAGFGKNTGYGLFLCREILSITAGMTITENSLENNGARFKIHIPMERFRNMRQKPYKTKVASNVGKEQLI